MKSTQISLSLPANLETLPKLHEELDAFGEQQHLTEGERYTLGFVCEELLVNTVEHGLTECSAASVEIELKNETECISIQYRDSSAPFNLLDYYANHHSPESLQVGGFGLFMVRDLCNRIDYAYVDGWNTVTLCVCHGKSIIAGDA